MVRFRVIFSCRAKKDLDSLSDNEFVRIINGCKRLEHDPAPDGKHIKKLRGYKEIFRLRVGDYRIVFECKGSEVSIVTVVTRQEFGKKY